MDATEWRFVSRRRQGAKADRNCHKVGQSFAPSSARYNGEGATYTSQCRVDQKGVAPPQWQTTAASIVLAIERLRGKLQLSELWDEIQSKLANAVHAEVQWIRSHNDSNPQPPHVKNGIPKISHSPGTWEFHDGVRYSLVCLGLGSPSECNDVMSCRYQLALALLLQRLLKIPSRRVHISDPVMNEVDMQVLGALHLSSGQEQWTTDPESPSDQEDDVEVVIYLAPHCDADLYGDILGLELALQPFCSRCFSCACPLSWEYRKAGARNDNAPSDNPSGSLTGSRGFVLIGNLLSSYEMRRSFFGELDLVQSPTACIGMPHNEVNRVCPGPSLGGPSGSPGHIVGQDSRVQPHSDELLTSVDEQIENTQHEMPSGANCAPGREASKCFDGAPEAAECRTCADDSTVWCDASATATVSHAEVCRWVTPSRGAFLLLELLPFVSEWPLERPFPAHPPAFNDLAVSRFPSPRTELQRAAFWRDAMQSLNSIRQSQPKNQRHRRRTGKRYAQR